MDSKKSATINYKGAQHFVALELSPGLMVKDCHRVNLTDTSGAFQISMPKAMLPFGENGDKILVALTFVQGEIVNSSPILRPVGAIDAKGN